MIEIRTRIGYIIYQSEKETIKEAVEDAIEKKIVDYKWKPLKYQSFSYPYFHNGKFIVLKKDWRDDYGRDTELFNKSWVFETDEECKKFCDKLNESIENVK